MAIESADAAPLAGISSMAVRQVLAELTGAYARQTGQQVAVESVGGVDAARRVREGEPFDFVVLAADAIEQLANEGSVVPESRVDVARSPIAIAAAVGARKPRLDNEDAVREAVLGAHSIGISTGPSGTHFARLLDRWGIGDRVAPRIVRAPAGVPVGTLVARGDAELGFQQLSELIDVPGIAVVGELPPDIQSITVFAGSVCRASARRDDAAAVLRFVASPDAATAKRRHGMAPA